MKPKTKNELDNEDHIFIHTDAASLVRDISIIANEFLDEQWEGLTHLEALKLAVQIQRNKVLADAFLLYSRGKTGLEGIAMAIHGNLHG